MDGLTQNKDQWHIRHNRRSPRRTLVSPSQKICDNLVIILLSFLSWQQTRGQEWQLVRFITWKSSRRMQMQSWGECRGAIWISRHVAPWIKTSSCDYYLSLMPCHTCKPGGYTQRSASLWPHWWPGRWSSRARSWSGVIKTILRYIDTI